MSNNDHIIQTLVITIEDLLDQDQFLEFDATNAGEECEEEIPDVNLTTEVNNEKWFEVVSLFLHGFIATNDFNYIF